MAEAAAAGVPPSRLIASDLSMSQLNHAFRPTRKYAFRGVFTLGGMPTYGQRLDKAMKLARTDRARVAKALGVTVQAVGQVLNGTTKAFTADKSAKVARFLAVDHFWLATGDGEPRPPDKLSEEAMDFARRYDRLNANERQRLSALLIAARDGVPDHAVEEKMPITRKVHHKEER
jgi:transcriptional regulator with XRE-family HTH domain